MSKNSDSKDQAKSYEPGNKDDQIDQKSIDDQNNPAENAENTSAVKYDVVFDDDDDALDLSLAASGQVPYGGSADDQTDDDETEDSDKKQAEADNTENTDTKDSRKASKAKTGNKTGAQTKESEKTADSEDIDDNSDDSDADETSENGDKASPDNVAASNAKRVNETLGLAVEEEDELSAHEAKSPVIEPATAVSTRLDKETVAEADILLKPNPTFALDHVTFTNRKSGRNVLDNIDWGFFAGSLYAITGADDEQRRGLLAVASGLYRPDSGQVMVKSQSLLELETNEIRGHRIGLVTQRYSLRNDLDALTNLTFTMRASGRTFLKPIPVVARDVLKYIDFDEAATGVKVSDLKPLNQRRLAIARAICCEATVILADDPVGGLDAGDRKIILDLLSRIAHAQDPKRCVIVLVPGFGTDTDANSSVDSAASDAESEADTATDSDEYTSATDYEAKADKIYSF
ncbi:ATP-binding cassette domain-containing protein [Bifidobacterium sp. ESL0769]|uniref:ATP-binding cassette domain-containing protein n=1 Tax=Bifidobacterium sp. ESL0769 TaxID=2983229 RepID=UPI0023FA356E|nr:ATP-binding cassette domain-containing protein [Bifidobacterium sp. ESL0769]WEV67612.1 ATP-binding cassette domain-containing protein [Bifidobacterium sp. ESL0769]